MRIRTRRRLVGARRSKGGLVALVNWLLHRERAARAEYEACAMTKCTACGFSVCEHQVHEHARLRRAADDARAEERALIRSKLLILANEYGDRFCYDEADALMNASDDLAPALAAAPVCGTCGGGGRYVVGHVYGGTAAPCPDCNGTGRAPGEGRGT